MSRKPLIAHVLYRLDVGGLERFIVTLINGTCDRYRHAVICLDGFGAMRGEIADSTVPCFALGKKPGKDLRYYFRLWRALRQLRPDLVQTYNFGALDVAPIAKLAGVRRVVHAERGRDASDPAGASRKYRRLHRWMNPFITHFLAVSQDLELWLVKDIGIDPVKIKYIGNGIDVARYAVPARPAQPRPLLANFAPPGTLLVVNVGRLDAVKDQAGLLMAFQILREICPAYASRLRLVIVGGGHERDRLQGQILALGLQGLVQLLGTRGDVPAILAESDIFALSSLAEGMPGVVLEAMAAELPVVATRVGGTAEVVADGETGILVAPHNPAALADAIGRYVRQKDLRLRHGHAGRLRAEAQFNLCTMLSSYLGVYDGLLARARDATACISSVKPASRGEP